MIPLSYFTFCEAGERGTEGEAEGGRERSVKDAVCVCLEGGGREVNDTEVMWMKLGWGCCMGCVWKRMDAVCSWMG